MFDNPIIFALITYGLALVIALMVAGIITLIHWAVKSRGGETAKEE